MSVSKYGLVGHPIGHSLSPFIHQSIMESEGLSGTYELFDLPPETFDRDIQKLMKKLDGFNLTLPYKSDILKHVKHIDRSADGCGAANTVYRDGAYNTDREGFLRCTPAIKGLDVLVTGSGGVARMMAFEAAGVCRKLYICSRNEEKARQLMTDIIRKRGKNATYWPPHALGLNNPRVDVILQGTPAGMWPNCAANIIPDAMLVAGQDIFDTIYNPPATRLVLRAKKAGASARGGMAMLFWQAVAAQKIWHPKHRFSDARLGMILPLLSREVLSRFPVKFVLTGFMGSGKSTVGALLAKRLGFAFYDLDTIVEKDAGKSISAIFSDEGEAAFRAREIEAAKRVLSEDKAMIVALGGGAILQEDMRRILDEQHARIAYLNISFEAIWGRIKNLSNRPLIGDPKHEAEDVRFTRAAGIYHDRLPLYRRYCDIIVNASGEQASIAAALEEAMGYGGVI